VRASESRVCVLGTLTAKVCDAIKTVDMFAAYQNYVQHNKVKKSI
jgi:hypothetical protein